MTSKRNVLTRRKLLASGLTVGGGMLIPGLGMGSIAAGNYGEQTTGLLIIGAGPFGLAISAYAHRHGINHKVVGVPMGFWKENMPKGMLLRSSCNWSLDPVGDYSIYGYLDGMGKECRDVEPLTRDFYLDYAEWMQKGSRITSTPSSVTSLTTEADGFIALFEDGSRIRSRAVVVAIGFKNFTHTPANLAAMFPPERQNHTCFTVDFDKYVDKRVLIIGGRQSAFEWTALIREAGAEAIHTCYRHETPLFEISDWSWVNELVSGMEDDPGWYRRLSEQQKKDLNHRFWAEGRHKLEPWLFPRIDHDNVHLHPNSNVIDAQVRDGGILANLDVGDAFEIDEVVFATGYKMDVQRVPFLTNGLLPKLQVAGGYPKLEIDFQTNIPGLYMTSLAATRDFGSFMAFTVSATAQANVIGSAVKKQLAIS
jgi:cation diffusion facilitator CzcD-associated flavoprotein CzcO